MELEFIKGVEDVVSAIPYGKVLTYGDVAALAGRPECARQVGKILGACGFDSPFPCHRVVNFQGRPAPHWPDQTAMLKAEGINFDEAGMVDMKIFRWKPEDDFGLI